jgi:YVTN family beta-propeller protein
VDERIMKDRDAAVRKGLEIPTLDDCLKCHKEKGSHTAVLKRPPVDVAAGMSLIAHRRPAGASAARPKLPEPPAANHPGPKYTGVMACVECHGAPAMGYQFSRWCGSKHAEAFAVLGTPAAVAIAATMGVQGDPQASIACLKCHTTAYHQPASGGLGSYSVYEGVGCEACHGAGSDYAREAVMKNRTRAAAAGLKKIDRETCLACHQDAHGKPFDHPTALKAIAHPTQAPEVVEGPRYKTPLNVAIRPDGKELYVACEAANSVIVVDAAARRQVAEIPVGGQPADVTFSPDGRRAYVSNRLDDSVSVIDVRARRVTATIPAGDEPHGVLTDRAGKTLYVLNTSDESISVVDAASLKEVKRLAAGRGPWSLALSPDGSRLCVTNQLSRFVKFRMPSMSEVTMVDVTSATVDHRIVVPGANLIQGVAWHPSGRYAIVTLLRTKNLVPMTRLLQGWTITNGLGIIWADGRVDQVLLDEPGQCFPDPTDVAVTPDGRLALVTSSSSDRVAVVDLPRLIGMLRQASQEERETVFPHHLGKAADFVVKHIATRTSPRGLVIDPAGKTAYVASALDDSLTVIDVRTLDAVGRVDLGGPAAITKARFGERIFHSAKHTFHRQFSCHSCHPDGHMDGLTYDTMPDGIGVGPVDNRTLRGILDTAPFKWEGTNPSLQRQCGGQRADGRAVVHATTETANRAKAVKSSPDRREGGPYMRSVLHRFWWSARLCLLRVRGWLLRRDERRAIIALGFEAAQHEDLAGFFRTVDFVGGLSGWDAPTLASAASVYYDAGQTREAIGLFEAAIEGTPDDATVLANYARYLFKEGRVENSLAHLERALRARPEDPWIMAWLGGCHFRLGNMAEARRWYTQSLEHDPDLSDIGSIHSYLGHIAARTQEWEEAARHWRQAAPQLPSDEEIWYNLGDALLHTGKYREAIPALEKNLRLGSEKPALTYYDLARCYQQLGEVHRAKALCHQALRYEPQDQDALDLKSELEASETPGHPTE